MLAHIKSIRLRQWIDHNAMLTFLILEHSNLLRRTICMLQRNLDVSESDNQ